MLKPCLSALASQAGKAYCHAPASGLILEMLRGIRRITRHMEELAAHTTEYTGRDDTFKSIHGGCVNVAPMAVASVNETIQLFLHGHIQRSAHCHMWGSTILFIDTTRTLQSLL